jgi:hypothetical protein
MSEYCPICRKSLLSRAFKDSLGHHVCPKTVIDRIERDYKKAEKEAEDFNATDAEHADLDSRLEEGFRNNE